MAAYPPLQAGKNLGVDDAKRNEGPTSITHRAFGLPPVDGKGHIIKAPWSGDQPRQETYTVKDREVQSQTTDLLQAALAATDWKAEAEIMRDERDEVCAELAICRATLKRITNTPLAHFDIVQVRQWAEEALQIR